MWSFLVVVAAQAKTMGGNYMNKMDSQLFVKLVISVRKFVTKFIVKIKSAFPFDFE